MIAELDLPALRIDASQLLQWGRDQLIAEFRNTFATFESHFLLQWGRDQLIAELFGVKPGEWFYGRFNGAAIN